MFEKNLELIKWSINGFILHFGNLSLIENVCSTSAVEDNCLLNELSYLRILMSTTKCELVWVDTKSQLADCLTKNSPASFKYVIEILKSSKHEKVMWENSNVGSSFWRLNHLFFFILRKMVWKTIQCIHWQGKFDNTCQSFFYVQCLLRCLVTLICVTYI